MIDSRLKQVISQLREGIRIPVIIELGTAPTPAAVRELSGAGLSVTTTSKISPLVYGTATSDIIRTIAASPSVVKVFYDEPLYPALALPFGLEVERQEVVPISEAVNAIGATKLWDIGINGKGVKIGIIDTGGSLTHPMLKDGIKDTYSAVPSETAEDMHSHGTWCASAAAGRPVETDMGVIYGVAPDADIYILKALSNDGRGQMSWVNDCLDTAILDFNCDVISMSLGSLTDMGGIDPTSRLVNDITRKYNKLCVVAAGNSGIFLSIGSPGGATGAITVGSVSMKLPMDGLVSTFSSKGPTTSLQVKPETAAYGGNILAPGISEQIYSAGAHGSYIPLAGTSMATPIVAGAMALLRQAKPDLSRIEVEQLLAEVGFPSPKNIFTGYGTIDIFKMYNRLNKPRLSIDKLGMPLQIIQGVMGASLSLMPRDVSKREQLNMVRLPYVASA